MPRQILIVDDVELNRKLLRKILCQDYDILEAENGEKALELINENHDRLSAVLLDILMPVMDGYAVLEHMHAKEELVQIPVIVTTGNTGDNAEIKALALGANDFIAKPYVPDVIKHRLRNTINLRETAATVNELRLDKLTGLPSREHFFHKAGELIKTQPPAYYVMACFDIDSFKVINDQYGNEQGDRVLKHVAKTFQTGFEPIGGLACRITADNFAALYPASALDSQQLLDIREQAAAPDASLPPISFSIGRYIVDDLSLSVSAMYDRAVLAKSSVKGRFDMHIAQYDESMRQRLLVEQEIVNEMKPALANGQFEVWLQPQYNHSSGALIGAEALVRWRHPAKGLISPASFIPVFERNGFIYELDKYVWDQTCALLRKWLDAGRPPLPISVNVSRYDLFREDLTDYILGLAEKYSLPLDLLRLEITESAFAKSTDQIIRVVKNLISQGFTVEIDDFGSGYSSLNTLKDVPAQIVKLDMRFLESSGNTDRGGNILESVVRMAKWLGMSVIAEGVEAKEQADYLKSIGCNYVQGFLYAKPMPPEQYEALTRAVSKEEKLLTMETVENLDNNSFWDPRSMDTLIFNTYVGGACIFEWHNDKIEILRANDKYAKIIGGENCTVEDALDLVWEEHMDAVAAQATREAIERAISTGEEATYEAVYFGLFGSQEKTCLRTTFRVIARTANRYLLYATNINLTSQRKAEEKERELRSQLQAVMENVNSGITAVITRGEEVEYLFVNDRFYEMFGYTREQYAAEVTNVFDLIHPDDRQRVLEAVEHINASGQPAVLEYRVICRDGSVIWERNSISVARFAGIDAPVQLGVATDITAERLAEEKIQARTEQLRFLNDTAGDLLAQTDVTAGVNTVLRKVLDYFGAVHSYIYEYDYEKELCVNTYDHYADEVTPYAESFSSVPLSDTWYWRKCFETSDFFRFDAGEELGEERHIERELYENIGASTILAVALRSGGKLIGAMGVDDPSRHLDDYDNLKALGDYMAVILTRRDLMAKIENDRQNLRELMNDTPGGFARMRVLPDQSLVPVFVNDGLCQLRGMSAQEILAEESKDVMHFVHPEDAETVKNTVRALLEGYPSSGIKFRIRHGNGSYIWVMTFARLSRNENGETWLNVYYADLSERDKMDITLEQTMPHILSAIMKYSSDLTFAKDKDFRYICCSPVFVKFAGGQTEKDIIGKTDYDLFSREIADRFRNDDMRLLESGEPLVDHVEPIPSSDGVQHYSNTSKYILQDSAGAVLGLYGVGRDITNEMSAFEQLKLLTNSIPGGIAAYEASPRGLRLTYFNDGYCGMMGYTRAEYEKITADGAMNITFEEDKPGLLAQIQALLKQDEPLDHTYRIHTKDGGYIWVNIRGVVSRRSGDISYINVVLFDVTQARLAQEAALIHEKEMRLAMSQMGRMICEYDPATRILTVPESFAALYGVSPTLPNVPESLIAAGIIDEATIPAYRGFFEAILRGEESGSAEYRDRSSDGSFHWERAEFYTIFDSHGQPVKAIIAVEDTTEQHLRYELERSRPMLGEENLLVHALFNLNTGQTLDYSYPDGRAVPASERTAFIFGGDNLEAIIINSEEREQYRRLNDPEKLLALYEQGQSELSIDYRRRLPSGDIIWVRNLLHMVREPGGQDILLFEYCYNIDEEKTRELTNRSFIRNNYDFIAYIDGRKGSYSISCNPNREFDMPELRGDDVDAMSREMAENLVHPEDREMTINNTLVEGIKRNLEHTEPFRFIYREMYPDGTIRYKKFTQYYLDREREIIISTREDVTSIMQEEIRKNQLLKEALEAANEENRLKERESAEQLKAIINNVGGGMFAATLTGSQLHYLYVNDEFYSLFGYTKEQMDQEAPQGLLDLIHPEDLPGMEEAIRHSEEAGSAQIEFRAYRRDQSLIWIRSISSTCQISGVSGPVHIAVLTDMTKEREAADALRMSKELFRIAASIGGRAIAHYDIKSGVYHHNNPELLKSGFGEKVENVPQAFIDSGNIAPESIDEYREFYEKLRRGEQDCSLDMNILMADGSFRWHRQEGTVIFDGDGQPSQAVLVLSDITDQREKEAVYIERAQADPLTGVLNRAAFVQAVEDLISRGLQDTCLALLMLDIDGFKQINDTYGHAMGDQVLVDMAATLRSGLRQEDILGRLGGDEFLICLRNMPDDRAIGKKAGQICALLHESLGHEIYSSTSIGIAVCPRDGQDFDTLYKKMDDALYVVKNQGKNNYAFYQEP